MFSKNYLFINQAGIFVSKLRICFMCLYKTPLELISVDPSGRESKAWIFGRSLAGIVVSNTPGAWRSVCCECCVLSDRGLCVGLVTHPEEFYQCGVSK